MNTRIKKLRESRGLSQAEFAEMLNLKRNSISLIEVGKRNPSDRTLSDICTTFNVSEEWLRNGVGEMFVETPSTVMDQLAKEYNLDDFSYRLVYRYLNLEEVQRQAVRDFFFQLVASDTAAGSDIKHTAIPDIPAAEAAYEKSLGIAPGTGSTALNTTDDTENTG